MPCNCGGQKKPPATAPVRRTIITTKKKDPPKVQKAGDRRPCGLCGWMMAKVRYRDVTSNVLIEKLVCPNHKCSNYNK